MKTDFSNTKYFEEKN